MAKLAINGGSAVFPADHSWPVWPQANKRDEQRLLRVLHSGDWGLDAEMTARFSARFAAYTGAKYVLPVNTGTAALELIVKALDIGPGDEVIVPAYTFVATATCALEVGATVVFADVAPDTWTIDPADVARRLTPRTRAIIPVHFAGNPAAMGALRRLVRGTGVALIEDAAHAHGMRYRGQAAGHHGVAAAYSFQSSKNMTCGEGGVLVTNRRRLFDHAWSCHSFGRRRNEPWYRHYTISWNDRVSAFQTALLLGQLERLERQTVTRHCNGAFLNRALSQIPGVQPQVEADARADTRRAYHLYMWRHDAAATGFDRETMIAALAAEGVPCSAGYPTPLPAAPMFSQRRFWHCHGVKGGGGERPAGEPDYASVETPTTARLCREAVWLGHPLLLGRRRDMQGIVDAVAKIVTHADELRGAKA